MTGNGRICGSWLIMPTSEADTRPGERRPLFPQRPGGDESELRPDFYRGLEPAYVKAYETVERFVDMKGWPCGLDAQHGPLMVLPAEEFSTSREARTAGILTRSSSTLPKTSPVTAYAFRSR